MNDIIKACHLHVTNYLKPGMVALDATAGNGSDTTLLAHCVGPTGRVYALDIQEQALNATRELLALNGVSQRVRLLQESHDRLGELMAEPINLIMFNLGYLPGGDKTITTHCISTMKALDDALRLLVPGGLLSVVTYSGHPGGREEEEEVANWVAGLSSREFSALSMRFMNKPNRPPCLWLVKKASVK
jgi:ubiquinone/menaquinone biosynthesis C-methylase UbiE